MSKTKHPEIQVSLIGQDGNAWSIIGIVQKAMRRGGVSQEEITQFQQEALSGDYDHLLQTAMAWVNVDGMGDEDGEPSGIAIDADEVSHVCGLCGKIFGSDTDLVEHYQEEHSDEEEEVDDDDA